MTKIRLVHTQEERGAILITDIDEGLPREFLDEERKQDVYVTYNKKRFEKTSEGVVSVVTETEVPGFIDLVESDKVMLSREHGAIAGLSAQGLVDVIEIPTGALNTPTITGAVQDDGQGAAGSGDVVITGTNFESFDPDETVLVLFEDATNPGTAQEFRADDTGVTFDFATNTLTVEATAHGTTVYSGPNAAAVVVANRLNSDPFDITHTP